MLLMISFSIANAQPVITSFSPASGAVGSSVTITGTGFNTTANQDIVFFGATMATVTAASATSVTVTVPAGATYQYFSITNLASNLTAYSAQPFIVTLSGAIAFGDKTDFTSGSNPRSISIGDIDGDGKPDLATANHGSNTVSVFLNTSTSGTVSFATTADFTAGSSPWSVCIGDIDGDGKPDIAVTNGGDNTVSVLLNTSTVGTINFASKLDFNTGSNPSFSVSIGDLDGDGKPDLAVVNNGDNTVSVLRNTSTLGSISFAAKADFTIGSDGRSVTIGDIDGDGKPDLATANAGSNNVSVLLNTSTTGSISFATKADFTTATGCVSISIGDLDGDGKPDLATANYNGSNVSVLRNTSTSGSISFDAKVDFTSGSGATAIRMGDIDGDGKPDLAVSNYDASTVSVLRNTSTSGAISFDAKVDYITGTVPYSVIIGDIDADGQPDLATANTDDNTISVLLQKTLPQGSMSANGPFCASGTGQLTWTATSGTGPFSVTYNDGVSNRTATNVTSGAAFNVFTNPVTVSTTYTLVSVTDDNNLTRTNGFTGGSATITVNSQPVVSATSATSICSGSSASLYAGAGSDLSFDGTNDYVEVASASSLNAYPLTVSALVKTSNAGTGNYGIITKYIAGSFNGYNIFMSGGHVYAFYFADNSNYCFDFGLGSHAIDGGVINDNVWHQVAMTVNASGLSIYVDGVLKDSQAWTGTPAACTTPQPLYFGRYGSGYFSGQMDEVRLWNAAQSGATLLANMSVPVATNASNLAGYWRLDNGAGLATSDLTGNGNTGTLKNGVAWVSPSTATINSGMTYVWSPSTGLSGTTGSSVSANPGSDQTYTVTGTATN